ncbi:hypothetical protein PPL_11168 [Heterostelium album PN500]|uniref:Uncharacterized protein n=1 Tax=Heterostelium pallidum (strain ATCC 26659 / Pp 5 / PN500) TaxID=670386 RepID=D3BTQ8_HETP5|nr:hypothetical protein PPL_11168 [Heterostelium album PN500]EFA75094.1 hypothetical protein PPL_11168 [Heterostelium album PN500]|eukprot:XP_020427228.1 hypothetical protein PPL_11168 [Heterostelium album PN500]
MYKYKDRYLIFNGLTHAQSQLIYNRSNHVTLTSYQTQFQRISDIQSCSLLICGSSASLKMGPTFSDYIIDISKVNNTENLSSKIPLNVRSVTIFEWQDNLAFDISDSRISQLEIRCDNLKILPGSLPNTLETLNHSNQRPVFNAHVLPNTIKYMTADYRQQELAPGLLPQSLERLSLLFNGNTLKEHPLPDNLKVLHICTFNMVAPKIDIGQLPRSLETLTLDYKIVDNIENLSILSQFQRLTTIECNFEWLSSLPPSITTLRFTKCSLGGIYIEPSVIPSTITNLDFGGMKLFRLKPGSIPLSVTKLSLGYFGYFLEPGVIPIGVRELDTFLSFSNISFGSIPNTVQSLKLSKYSDGAESESAFLGILSLPSIKKLSFDTEKEISRFPPNLELLKLTGNNNQLLHSSLPPTLKNLILYQIILVKDVCEDSAHQQPQRLTMNVDSSFFRENTLEDLPISVEIIRINGNIELRRYNQSSIFIGYNRDYLVNGGFIESTQHLRDLINNRVFKRHIINERIAKIIT